MKSDSRGAGVQVTRDRVLGGVGGVMILFAVYLLFFGGPSDDGVVAPLTVPRLELLSPADGAEVDRPLELRFSTPAPLSSGPGGWGAVGLHIHVEVDGREGMPAPTDIRPEGDGVYLWTLGRVTDGERTIRLFWADAAHRAIEEGATAPVRVIVR